MCFGLLKLRLPVLAIWDEVGTKIQYVSLGH